MMKKSTLLLMALGAAVMVGDLVPGGIVPGGVMLKEAQAIVGRPATPVSVAGGARRTTRRGVVGASGTGATLPPARPAGSGTS